MTGSGWSSELGPGSSLTCFVGACGGKGFGLAIISDESCLASGELGCGSSGGKGGGVGVDGGGLAGGTDSGIVLGVVRRSGGVIGAAGGISGLCCCGESDSDCSGPCPFSLCIST